jgi:hypothetical protein
MIEATALKELIAKPPTALTELNLSAIGFNDKPLSIICSALSEVLLLLLFRLTS